MDIDIRDFFTQNCSKERKRPKKSKGRKRKKRRVLPASDDSNETPCDELSQGKSFKSDCPKTAKLMVAESPMQKINFKLEPHLGVQAPVSRSVVLPSESVDSKPASFPKNYDFTSAPISHLRQQLEHNFKVSHRKHTLEYGKDRWGGVQMHRKEKDVLEEMERRELKGEKVIEAQFYSIKRSQSESVQNKKDYKTGVHYACFSKEEFNRFILHPEVTCENFTFTEVYRKSDLVRGMVDFDCKVDDNPSESRRPTHLQAKVIADILYEITCACYREMGHEIDEALCTQVQYCLHGKYSEHWNVPTKSVMRFEAVRHCMTDVVRERLLRSKEDIEQKIKEELEGMPDSKPVPNVDTVIELLMESLDDSVYGKAKGKQVG